MSASYPKSVYRDDIYKAFFRDGEFSWVHCLVLKRHPKLEKRTYAKPGEAWPLCVDLKDFDHNTGHTIIHYLYTGNYQRLRPNEWIAGETNKHDLAEGLRICIAANSLMLFSLHLQAEQEIERVGDRLSLQVIFEVVENSNIALDQVPRFRSYLQRRMTDARFGAPAEDLRQVLSNLDSASTLSALVLKTMVLKHRLEVYADSKTDIAPPNQSLAKSNDQQPLKEAEGPTALQLLEREIEERQTNGKGLKVKDRKRLTTLESAASVLRSGENGKKAAGKGIFIEEPSIDGNKKKVVYQTERSEDTEDELMSVETVSKSKGKGKIEAWMRLESGSYRSRLAEPEDSPSDWTVSMTEMTPSSKGGSCDVLDSVSEDGFAKVRR